MPEVTVACGRSPAAATDAATGSNGLDAAAVPGGPAGGTGHRGPRDRDAESRAGGRAVLSQGSVGRLIRPVHELHRRQRATPSAQ